MKNWRSSLRLTLVKKMLEIKRRLDPRFFDLVILDMIMPDMNGSKVYDLLRAISPDVKVLLSSGYSIDGQANEILERGCNGFIQKPFSIKELSEKINEILVAESASMSRH